MAIQMDPAFFIAAAIFFGLVACALWINGLLSRRTKSEIRQVGYQRTDIEIDPRAVPEFKPTWRNLRDEGEAR